jgi:GxxExxY protein
MHLNEITGVIVDAAMKVHSALGPGLLESVYETCLIKELHKRGLRTASQVSVPVVYEGEKLEAGYRLDLLVEGHVVVEIKAVDAINPLHRAQLLTYLRLAAKPVGLLINFKVVHLREGIRRVVNNCPEGEPLRDSASSAASASKSR